MTHSHHWIRVLSLGLVIFAAAPTSAQLIEVHPRSGVDSLKIGGRLHAQFATSSADEGKAADQFIRRARITADIWVNDLVSGRIQNDFIAGLLDAYAQLNFSDGFRVRMGQFKRSFDLFELASSTRLQVIERDARIDGVSDCTGVGGVCSLSRLTEKLGYAGRDMGLQVFGRAHPRISYQVSMTNGTGTGTKDENGAKSFSGRLTADVADKVELSAAVSLHDYPLDADNDEYGVAFNLDLEIGGWENGLHVLAGGVVGDNWAADDGSGDPPTFATGQGIVSYYKKIANAGRLTAVEPLVRLSWADPDTDTDDDASVAFTPGVLFHFGNRNKIGANLDVLSPQIGDTEWSLKIQTFLYF